MAKKSQWLAGCGIGCAVVLLVVVVAIVSLVSLANRETGDLDVAGEMYETLVARFGEPGNFAPPAGEIPAERLEAFLAVRDSLVAPRRVLLAMVEELLVLDAAPHNPRNTYRQLRAGLRMAGQVGAFQVARNAALDAAGMGPGEYTWLYCLANHAWPGRPASADMLSLGLGRDLTAGQQVAVERAMRDVWRRIHDELEAMTRAGASALEAEGDPRAADWRGEIAALERDPMRTPFQGVVPAAAAASLEPFAARLEASFAEDLGMFELVGEQDDLNFQGGISWD